MKNNYLVEGLFYEVKGLKCRKFLDIKLIGSGVNKPDIMVVMMNPGSSKPKDGIFNNERATEAVPDKTQFQIMRVMERSGFKYARILNLSDLIKSKSKDFFTFLKSQESEEFTHSIFHNKRSIELTKLFQKNVPVIFAWGVNSILKELAQLVITSLECQNPIGILKDNCKNRNAYYHPLPQNHNNQKRWVNQVVKQLEVNNY